MQIFGRGDYFLQNIKDEMGVEYPQYSLSNKTKWELLSNPPQSDIEYLIKSLLQKTSIEFAEFHENEKLHYILNDFSYSYDYKSERIIQNNQELYEIDLSLFPQVPGLAYMVCNDNGEIIARILMAGKDWNDVEICIISKYPLFIKGEVAHYALKIYSKSTVELANDLRTQNRLFVHASSISTQEDLKLNVDSMIFHSEKESNLHGRIEANQVDIAAGLYQGHASIIANTVKIIAEHANQFSTIKAIRNISLASLTWKNLVGSHLHCPGSINILTNVLSDKGLITANQLSLYGVYSSFKGKYYVAKDLHFNLKNTLNIDKKARFVCSGHIQQSSALSTLLKGNLVYSPYLKVNWNKVVDPTMEYDPWDFSPSKKTTKDVTFIPYVPAELESMLSNIDYIKPVLTSGHVNLYGGKLLEMKGTIEVNGADINLASNNCLDVMGSIWQSNFFQSYSITFQAKSLHFNGFAKSDSAIRMFSNKDIEHKGRVQADQVYIQSENYTLTERAQLKSNNLIIHASDKVILEGTTRANISAVIKSKRFMNSSQLNSEILLVEAEKYIINTGSFNGSQQSFAAPLFFSSGGINAKEVNVNASLSFMTGINHIGALSNNSLISIAPAIFFQTAINLPNTYAASMTLANIGFSACDYLYPAQKAVISLLRFGLNSVSQLLNVSMQAKHVYDTSSTILVNPNSTNTVRMTTTITQSAISSAFAISSFCTGYSNLSLFSPDMAVPELLPLLEDTFSNALFLFSGYNNYSVVNVSTGLFLGVTRTNYSILNFNSNLSLSLTQVNNHFCDIDSSYNLSIGPTTNSGYENVTLGNGISLLGHHSVNYNYLIILPELPIHYQNWTMASDHLTVLHETSINNSIMNAQEVNQQAPLNAVTSSIIVKSYNQHAALNVLSCNFSVGTLDQLNTFDVGKSRVNIKEFYNRSEAHLDNDLVNIQTLENFSTLESKACVGSIEKFNNIGIMNIIESSLSGDKFTVSPRASLLVDKSEFEYKTGTNQGKFIFTKSGGRVDAFINSGTATIGESGFNGDTLTVDSKGSLFVDKSRLDYKTETNRGKSIFSESEIHFKTQRNTGRQQFIRCFGTITNLFNTGLEAFDACKVKCTQMNNSAGAVMGIRASQVFTDIMNNIGKLAVNDSYIKAIKLNNQGSLSTFHSILNANVMSGNFDNNHFLGRDTSIYSRNFIPGLESIATANLSISAKTTHSVRRVIAAVSQELHSSIKHENTKVIHSDMDNTTLQMFLKHLPKAVYHEGKIYYQYDDNVSIDSWQLHSVLPLVLMANNFNITGKVSSNVELDLYAKRNILVSLARLAISGNSMWQADNNVTILDSFLAVAGNLTALARKQARIIGSEFIAKGIDINGAKGMYVGARVTTEKESHSEWKWQGLHSGYVTKTNIITKVKLSTFNSTTGNLYLHSSEGNFNGHGIVATGANIYINGHGNANIFDIQGINAHEIESYSLLGYRDRIDSRTISVPSALLSQGNVYLNSEAGKLHARGVLILAPNGELFVHSGGGKATFERPKLNNYYSQTVVGITYVDIPALSAPILSYMPLAQSTNQLLQSNNPLGIGLNAANVVAESINTGQNIIDDLNKNKSELQTTLDTVSSPNLKSQIARLGIGIGIAKFEGSYQSLGQGGVIAKTVHLDAKEVSIKNAFTINTKDMYINATTFNFNGANLRSDSSGLVANIDLSAGLDNSNHFGVGVGVSLKQNSGSTIQAVMNPSSISHLHLNVVNANFMNTNLELDKLSGTAKNISIQSSVNINSSSSASLSGSENSATANFQKSYKESIPVRSGLFANDAKDFEVGHVSTQDSDIGNNISRLSIDQKNSHLKNEERHLSVGGTFNNVKSNRIFNPIHIDSGFTHDQHTSETNVSIPIPTSMQNIENLLDATQSYLNIERIFSNSDMTDPTVAEKQSSSGMNVVNSKYKASVASEEKSPKKPAPLSELAKKAIEKKEESLIAKNDRFKDDLADLDGRASESKPATDYLKDKNSIKIDVTDTKIRLFNRVGKLTGVAAIAQGAFEIINANSPEESAKVAGELACTSGFFEAGTALLPAFPYGTAAGLGLFAAGLWQCNNIVDLGADSLNEFTPSGKNSADPKERQFPRLFD